MIQFLIYLLFFLSGACGLIYEIIWLRKLSIIFGNTTYATSTILAIFMGGLALGSLIFGRYADKAKSALKLYGILELGIGVSAIGVLLFLLPVSDNIYIWAFNQSPIVLTVIRFLLSIVLLIIPTTLMGGTLPVISKYFIKQTGEFGKKIGGLYALNTFGGIAGSFFTGYFFIRLFGESSTVWIAIILNFLIGLIAVRIGGRQNGHLASNPKKVKTKKRNQAGALEHKKNKVKIRSYSAKTAFIILWLFGFAGFTSLAYEVVWARALVFYVSSTTYSFTIILVTFLFGITIGSLLMSKVVDRIKNLVLVFGFFEMGIALTAILSIPLIKNMDKIQHWIFSFLHSSNWTHLTLLLFLTAFVVLVLPTLFMGAVFPVVSICVENLPKLGRGVGSVYMSNTLGAIFGSLLSGFLILPLLGIQTSILLISTINLIVGIFIIFFENNFQRIRIKLFSATASAIVLFLIFNILFFTTQTLYSGVVSFKETKILYSKDALTATLSALEKKEEINIWGRNVRFLNINGHNTAHTTYADIIIHKMLAHLPMLLHPNPESALVIGFGFGNTCQSFLDYDIKKVDCVELVKEEQETAKFFIDENKGVFEDSRFQYKINDGRNYVLATKESYDIISINAVDPKFSPFLYTNEFYELCKNRLQKNGSITAWLPISGMTLEEIKSLMKSFVTVFPNSSLWYNNPEHLLLFGTKNNALFNYGKINKKLSNANVKRSLESIRMDNPYTLLSTFFMGNEALTDFCSDSECHSDDLPIVEFSQVPTPDIFPEVYYSLMEKKESVFPFLSHVTDTTEDSVFVYEELVTYEKAMFSMLKGLYQYRLLGKTNFQDTTLTKQAFKLMWEGIDLAPGNKFNLLFFVDWVHHMDLSASVGYFHRAVEEEPDFAKAWVLLGLERAQNGDIDNALKYYQNAQRINANYISANYNAGIAYAQKEDWDNSLFSFTKVLEIQADNAFAHSNISQVYYMKQNYEKAIEHIEASIKIIPKEAHSYFNLGMMYEKNKQIEEAIEAFENGLELTPNDLRAREKLTQLKNIK